MGLCAFGVCASASNRWNTIYEWELNNYGHNASRTRCNLSKLVCQDTLVSISSAFGFGLLR
jgi:Fe-S cluster assembly scaffold protein SufB